MKLILTTVNQKSQAEKIAQALLKDQLAACVNFFPCSSRYRWQGKIKKSSEFQLIIKTKDALIKETITKLKKVHPYDLPVIEVIKVEGNNSGVKEWMDEVTK
ncbi:MAG TPA: divalent-cation tolerance protein CutA [Candidatus Nanoarchaeia archaeon]|nr:divalent-cation tolerance protein CutA [Candidatus Nanoarchaeia archaeon]